MKLYRKLFTCEYKLALENLHATLINAKQINTEWPKFALSIAPRVTYSTFV